MEEPHAVGPGISFSLWREPWIVVDDDSGSALRVSLEKALLESHHLRSLSDTSPLVVAGVHRLLTAILQAIYRPERPGDLARIHGEGRFRPEAVAAFGQQHGARFDLFSTEHPFLQSADIPLAPQRGDDLKSVSQLAAETSRSTALSHFRHGRALDEVFCAPCAAAGLVTIPPFISSGGAGLKPSINGVPPIYVLPGGETLFESLALSLVLPPFQPQARSPTEDRAWWTRSGIVKRSSEVDEVGYLHSLTFAARRVRLHPEPMDRPCTRCGAEGTLGVRTMVFEMGESRAKEAAFWQDPFAGYKIAEGKPPVPIRPSAGKALWREFAGLFLSQAAGMQGTRLRPRLLDQIADLGLAEEYAQVPFRCVGVRTDMKAKVFEWIDAGFDVPPALLRDEDAAAHVTMALSFAGECLGYAAAMFKAAFGKSKKQERHQAIRVRMVDECWAELAAPFREYILALPRTAPRSAARIGTSRAWGDGVTRAALGAFRRAAAETGDDASALRRQVQAEKRCTSGLYHRRAQYWKGEERE
jgi:CRISPR system Cascade subunit CasA